MEIKVCPYCGSHNYAKAIYCSSQGCHQSLSDVPITIMDDDKVHLVRETASSMPWLNRYKTKDTGRKLGLSCLGVIITTCCLGNLLFSPITFGALFDSYTSAGQKFLAVLGAGAMGILLIGLPVWLLGWLWFWPLIDCIKNEPSIGNERLIWILVTLFGGGIGGTIYLLTRRSQRIEKYGH